MAISLLGEVHYTQGNALFGATLVILSLYTMYEKSIRPDKRSNRRFSGLFRNNSKLSRKRTEASSSESSKTSNRSSKSLTDFGGSPHPSDFSLSAISTSTIQAIHPVQSSLSNPLKDKLYHAENGQSGSMLVDITKTPSGPGKLSIRKHTLNLVKTLQSFAPHALAQPLLILSKSLLRALDNEAQLVSVSRGGQSVSSILREEAQKLYSRKVPQMRYLVIVLAMKSWRLSDDGSYEDMHELAENLAREGRIEGCLSIL